MCFNELWFAQFFVLNQTSYRNVHKYIEHYIHMWTSDEQFRETCAHKSTTQTIGTGNRQKDDAFHPPSLSLWQEL